MSVAEYASLGDFRETLDRLVGTIEKAGLTIFARIDHAVGARQAGMEMPPTVVLIYGHATGCTPIMQASPQAALDLPLREDADGQVMILFHPIASVLQQAGVPDRWQNTWTL